MNSGVFIDKRRKPTKPADAVLALAYSRSKHFGKYGERFERRLYAEIESIIRLWYRLDDIGIISSDPVTFKKLVAIQRGMLKQAEYLEYDQFP